MPSFSVCKPKPLCDTCLAQALCAYYRTGETTDVRKATEEQVKSLGAKFVYADIADAATSGGYAKELSAEDKAKQAALVANRVKESISPLSAASIAS